MTEGQGGGDHKDTQRGYAAARSQLNLFYHIYYIIKHNYMCIIIHFRANFHELCDFVSVSTYRTDLF